MLCYVTDRVAFGAAGGDALIFAIRRAIAAGADWVQIREKDLPARALQELTRAAVAAAGRSARILVNDRLDVALAASAAGVHLGSESAPVGEVARWCRDGNAPRGFLIGRSCHQLAEALDAERAGADYVFFGPVFATPSKVAYGAPQGITPLAETCRAIRIAVLAIGGISEENAVECFRAGAAGIAAIRLFQQAGDLTAITTHLRGIAETARGDARHGNP